MSWLILKALGALLRGSGQRRDEDVLAEREAAMAAFTKTGGGSSSKIGREVRFRGQTGKTYARSEPYRFLPLRSFGSIHWTCLSALLTDRVMEAWYHPSIA